MRRKMRWPLTGVLGVIALVSVLVIPAMGDGPVTGEVGVLRLHLNADGDRFVFEPSTGLDLTQTLTQSNCKLASSGDSLVSFVASSSHSSKKPFAGLKDHRIGVGQNHEGSGEPCARIDKELGQTLTLKLGSGLGDVDLGYAEIDLGFKYNGAAELELRKDGKFVDKVKVLCTGGSDCGPDSGKSDNERVVLWFDASDNPGAGHWQSFQIDGVFDTIVIKPVATSHKGKGVVSLEGGFNGSAPGPLGTSLASGDTLFKVVGVFDGEIACGETESLGGGNASTEITRGPDSDGGCKGPADGLLFDFESGAEEDGRLFVDFIIDPVEGSSFAQFLEVITWVYDSPPDVPGGDQQNRILTYDDHIIGVLERDMPWCLIDPRVGGGLPLTLDPDTVLPVGHTSCLIEATSRVTLIGGDFVETDVVYNIGDGKRSN